VRLTKLEVLALVFIVAFATCATVISVGLQGNMPHVKDVRYAGSYGTTLVDNNGTTVEPQKEIDTPGMPG
jgi:hypothetical protein